MRTCVSVYALTFAHIDADTDENPLISFKLMQKCHVFFINKSLHVL